MITTSFRRNFRQLSSLPAGSFRQFSEGVAAVVAAAAAAAAREKPQRGVCCARGYKLPLPFMRVYYATYVDTYVYVKAGIARGRESSLRP